MRNSERLWIRLCRKSGVVVSIIVSVSSDALEPAFPLLKSNLLGIATTVSPQLRQLLHHHW